MRHVRGPHRSAQQHPERHAHHRCAGFTARLTVAGGTPKDLATRRWLTPLATISMTTASCSSDNRRGAPVSCRPPSPSPNPPWCGGEWTPRRGNRPGYSPRTTPSNRGRHPGTGPKTIHYLPGWESSPRAVADRGCCPWCPASAARCGRWTPQPRCRPGPTRSPESAKPVGCWYRSFRRRRHPDRCEKAPRRQPATAGVRFPGRCPTARRLWSDWCGRSRRYRASLSLQLVRIAPYLCDPHPNKLKGVICGPVSQTRVCDPPQPGRLIHMDRSGADQKLVR